jgi:hypothetical protein
MESIEKTRERILVTALSYVLDSELRLYLLQDNQFRAQEFPRQPRDSLEDWEIWDLEWRVRSLTI